MLHEAMRHMLLKVWLLGAFHLDFVRFCFNLVKALIFSVYFLKIFVHPGSERKKKNINKYFSVRICESHKVVFCSEHRVRLVYACDYTLV